MPLAAGTILLTAPPISSTVHAQGSLFVLVAVIKAILQGLALEIDK